MRRSRKIALAAAVLVATSALRAPAQVLDQTPAGALMVVKIKNLAETNTKVAAFLKELGVDQMSPDLADPLAALKKKLNITQGLDDKGEMEIAYLDPAVSGADEEHSVVFLLPVSDYKAFTANFADAKTEGDVTTVQMPDQPEPSYVVSWGNYAAISPSKEVLAKKPEGGLKVKGSAAKELSDKDAVLYVNMEAVRAKVLPDLKNNRDTWVNQAAGALEGDNQKYAGLVKAAVGEAIDIATGYITQTDSVTYGWSIGTEGIKGTLLSEFQPGTYGGDTVKSIKDSDDGMLTGLPNAKYLVYGGIVATPDVSTKVLNDLLAPVLPEVQKLGDETKPITDYIDAVKKMVAAGKSESYGMLTPSGMMGQDSVLQIVQILRGDSKALGEAQKAIAEQQQDMMKVLQPNSPLQTKTTFTPAAKTVDGVSFDQIITDFTADPNSPMGQNAEQGIRMLYGPDGMKMLSGAVDDETRLITMSAPDDAVQQLITAVKAKDDSLAKSDSVSTVSAELPKERVAATYFAVDNVISAGLKYASAMGMNLPINLPPNQPPVGATVSTDGTAVRADVYIPTKLVKTVTSAVMAFVARMQGGNGGGGGANGPGL